MKKLLTLSIAVSLATNMMAVEPNSDGLEKDKAVYLELLGASNMVASIMISVSTTIQDGVGEQVLALLSVATPTSLVTMVVFVITQYRWR